MHGEAFCPSSHRWQGQPVLISDEDPYQPRAPSAVPGWGFRTNGGRWQTGRLQSRAEGNVEVHANAPNALIKRDVHSTHRQEKGTDQRTWRSQRERGPCCILDERRRRNGRNPQRNGVCASFFCFCQLSDFSTFFSPVLSRRRPASSRMADPTSGAPFEERWFWKLYAMLGNVSGRLLVSGRGSWADVWVSQCFTAWCKAGNIVEPLNWLVTGQQIAFVSIINSLDNKRKKRICLPFVSRVSDDFLDFYVP